MHRIFLFLSLHLLACTSLYCHLNLPSNGLGLPARSAPGRNRTREAQSRNGCKPRTANSQGFGLRKCYSDPQSQNCCHQRPLAP
ncbi:hypothetical protein B0H13DRAFT_2000437 [Mycena leptocephala]|nr:hypothetical protein B0H13DRAFT_2000437 [Mycena leptocephala]